MVRVGREPSHNVQMKLDLLCLATEETSPPTYKTQVYLPAMCSSALSFQEHLNKQPSFEPKGQSFSSYLLE